MTQIKKTLSIAGIIALVGAPAMADIASTDYVQSIVNNMIPKTGTVGHVLKKTATGLEWAAAPTPTLETTTGQSTTASMTQKAITDALNKKLENNATNTAAVAIGREATTLGDKMDAGVSIGFDADSTDTSVAIGYTANAYNRSVALGSYAEAVTGEDAIAIGYRAFNSGYGSILLGRGTVTEDHTLNVGLGESIWDGEDNYISYPLLVSGGVIPAGRLATPNFDEDGNYASDNNGTAGQILQTNGDGTMSWVNAPAPTLASLLPELPSDCNSVKCALVHDNTDGQYKWEVVKVSE